MIKTPIVILHRYPYSESSFIVKALSPDVGVISLLIKGARRKESSFRASLDPLAIAEVVYRHSTRSELQLPREATLVRYHTELRKDLERLAMAQVIAETVLRLAQSGGHYREEFELVANSFLALDQDTPQVQAAFILAHFLQSLTESLGFELRLERCVECENPLHSAPADLWPAMGGGVCASCLGTRRPSWNLDFLQQLYVFIELHVDEGSPSRLEHFFISFLRIHTGLALDIRSLAWLDELRGTSIEGEHHAESQ